jgi:hypothetical protein
LCGLFPRVTQRVSLVALIEHNLGSKYTEVLSTLLSLSASTACVIVSARAVSSPAVVPGDRVARLAPHAESLCSRFSNDTLEGDRGGTL